MKDCCAHLAIIALAILSLAFGCPAPARAAIAPDVLVRTAAEDVLNILRSQAAVADDTAALSVLVEQKVIGHFDFVRMTRLAVGKHWRAAAAPQQETLAAEFQTLLVRTYTVALGEFRDYNIDYRPAEVSDDGTRAVVRTNVSRSGGKPVHMDYRMIATGDDWKVYDVLVDGVSLVVNYRSLFGTTVERAGIDGLIELLREKNARVSTQ